MYLLNGLLFFHLAYGTITILEHESAYAWNGWKSEYAEVCGKTQNAIALSKSELKNYIDRCDTLRERLDELNGASGTEKKVFTKRLGMCREMYLFALEYKGKKEESR